MICLVPNIGSTSFKYRVLDLPENAFGQPVRVLAQGRIERIGRPGGECADYPAAIRKCIADIAGPGRPLASLAKIDAVGFKAVHAGPLAASRIIDDELLAAMEEFAFLAPAHNPPYVAAIRAFREVLPGVPMVAVLETEPYGALTEASTTYAVPYEWRTSFGIRRYGFHGASHRSAHERVRELFPDSRLRHISCHLGGSSSLAAFRDGVAVDTSFGASPQSGLPQNNRVGDIDVFAVLHMMKKLGLDPDQMADVLAVHSGLAGISGTSGDLRDLTEAASRGHERSRLALDVYVHAIRRYLGALMVSLGGFDFISFSGGIGENSPEIRAAVLKDLGTFGILLDENKNCSLTGEGIISAEDSPVTVLVIPANEEWIVARETVAIVSRALAVAQPATQGAL